MRHFLACLSNITDDLPGEQFGDIGEEVEGVPQQGGLHVGDGLHPGDVRINFGFFL